MRESDALQKLRVPFKGGKTEEAPSIIMWRFPRLRHEDICPRCKERNWKGLNGKDWRNWVPKSKHYQCRNYSAPFVTISGRAISLPKWLSISEIKIRKGMLFKLRQTKEYTI
jgi:hypothetical protein